MEKGLNANNINFKPGQQLRLRGEILPNAKRFAVNLGKDAHNVCLHFNPRFEHQGDVSVIVCNSKNGGAWGVEQRETAFPFEAGTTTEVCISFDRAEIAIKLSDGYSFKFPNHHNMEVINYMETEGDFRVISMAFE